MLTTHYPNEGKYPNFGQPKRNETLIQRLMKKSPIQRKAIFTHFMVEAGAYSNTKGSGLEARIENLERLYDHGLLDVRTRKNKNGLPSLIFYYWEPMTQKYVESARTRNRK